MTAYKNNYTNMTYHCEVLRHLQDRTKGFVRRIQQTSNTWEADIEFTDNDFDYPPFWMVVKEQGNTLTINININTFELHFKKLKR